MFVGYTHCAEALYLRVVKTYCDLWYLHRFQSFCYVVIAPSDTGESEHSSAPLLHDTLNIDRYLNSILTVS